METESSEVSQVNALCSSPSKHFVGRTKANECRERYGKVTVFPQLEQHALATILWSYTILYYCAPKAPNKVMHTQTQNVPLFSKRGKMMLKGPFLPCHWHLLITGVLGMLQTSPSPLPIDFGQGQAQSAVVLAWPTHPTYCEHV